MSIEIDKDSNGYYAKKIGFFTTRYLCFLSCSANPYSSPTNDNYFVMYFDSKNDAISSAKNPDNSMLYWHKLV